MQIIQIKITPFTKRLTLKHVEYRNNVKPMNLIWEIRKLNKICNVVEATFDLKTPIHDFLKST